MKNFEKLGKFYNTITVEDISDLYQKSEMPIICNDGKAVGLWFTNKITDGVKIMFEE